jgi:hypothetical protein
MQNTLPILKAASASEIRAKMVTIPFGSQTRSSIKKYPLVSSGGSGQRANLDEVMGEIDSLLPSSTLAVRYSSAILASERSFE